MTARRRTFVAPGRRVSLLLLMVGLLIGVSAQSQVPDTTRTGAAAKDLPLTAAQRQVFIGTYSVTLPQGEPTSLRVYEENGALMGQPEHQEAKRLLHQGENVFFVEGVPDFSLAFVVENGRATKFTLRKADGMGEGVRLR
jgi:hypothetical protein